MPQTKIKPLLDAAAPSGVPIPESYPQPFRNGIAHPELWLWDSWFLVEDTTCHLYCLALSRTDKDGQLIPPQDRNLHQFHIRHFISQDGGRSWLDKGVYFKPEITSDGYFDRNIWSGSILKVNDNRYLTGFTAIRSKDAEHPFVQSIGLAVSGDDKSVDHVQDRPLSCPVRDYEQITSLGYYLGPKESLGHEDGEEGGPILAWRDPYLYQDGDGRIHAFWSAKVSPKEGAMAHATLSERDNGFVIEKLHPPIRFPDSEKFTQAEVPKIYNSPATDEYYCLLAACDRLYEGQPDSQVTKVTRLYKAPTIRGPWQAFGQETSKLEGLDNLFGCSIIEADFDAGKLVLVAPVTEMAAKDVQLTFADIITLHI
ncbi:MAG: hypothetical protein EX271_04725 [Acidimicrobiales bacterium]|nr:hypothetical protein [Hyphomonadaceae bacterium]RZV42994.1 MAG: hypothetical protein EX271_04725 [Acidimicrobiales bacterium]